MSKTPDVSTPTTAPPTSNRTCGKCTVCCTAMAVDELGKLEGVACVHLDPGGKGCQLYGDPRRPRACQEWNCGWLQDGVTDTQTMPDRWRPDHCGVIIDPRMNDSAPEGFLVCLWLLRQAGHVRTGKLKRTASKILNLFGEQHVCMMMRPGGQRRVVGPDHALKAFFSALQARQEQAIKDKLGDG